MQNLLKVGVVGGVLLLTACSLMNNSQKTTAKRTYCSALRSRIFEHPSASGNNAMVATSRSQHKRYMQAYQNSCQSNVKVSK
jgi:hypothetical protein